jgi:hypothetical protein
MHAVVKERQSQLIFELSDLLAQGGRGDVQGVRRVSEVTDVHNCDEVAQNSEISTQPVRPRRADRCLANGW